MGVKERGRGGEERITIGWYRERERATIGGYVVLRERESYYWRLCGTER